MNIYDIEKEDGLSEVIKANASFAYASKLFNSMLNESNIPENVKAHVKNRVIATNIDQPDLYYLCNILVSTGLNKNDDYFAPEEVWAARKSPEDKPFNRDHKFTDIIGHMTECVVLDNEGNIIEDDGKVPESFDILTNAVIYRKWPKEDGKPDEVKEAEIEATIVEIEDNKYFVSMEASMAEFDYVLIPYTKGGELDSQSARIVKRNKETAFLSKYLRAYNTKATGKYKEEKIGRVLRGINFTAEGLVKKPANLKSIIMPNELVKAEMVDNVKVKILSVSENMVYENDSSIVENKIMADENKIKELELALTKANEEIALLKNKDAASDLATAKASLFEIEKKLAAESEAKAKVATELETAKVNADKVSKELVTANENLKVTNEKLEKIEADKKFADRVKKVKEVFAFETEDEAVKAAEACRLFSDEQFELHLNTVAIVMTKVVKIGTKEKSTTLEAPAAANPRVLKAGEVLEDLEEGKVKPDLAVAADETDKSKDESKKLGEEVLEFCKPKVAQK